MVAPVLGEVAISQALKLPVFLLTGERYNLVVTKARASGRSVPVGLGLRGRAESTYKLIQFFVAVGNPHSATPVTVK
jgi:hypothetical protein